VHERALMADVVREVERVATAGGAVCVSRVAVELGALSHFTPSHFEDHFREAARGTIADGAEVEVTVSHDAKAAAAQTVLLRNVEIEVPS